MSADNWGTCPKCVADAKARASDAIQRAAEAYGKVPATDYERLKSVALEAKAAEPEPTLREDYELGMREEGIFYVSYSCHCRTCDFSWEYDDTKKVF